MADRAEFFTGSFTLDANRRGNQIGIFFLLLSQSDWFESIYCCAACICDNFFEIVLFFPHGFDVIDRAKFVGIVYCGRVDRTQRWILNFFGVKAVTCIGVIIKHTVT